MAASLLRVVARARDKDLHDDAYSQKWQRIALIAMVVLLTNVLVGALLFAFVFDSDDQLTFVQSIYAAVVKKNIKTCQVVCLN